MDLPWGTKSLIFLPNCFDVATPLVPITGNFIPRVLNFQITVTASPDTSLCLSLSVSAVPGGQKLCCKAQLTIDR